MDSQNINVIRVDYSNPTHAADLQNLLREYAEIETEAETPIPADFFAPLPSKLAAMPTAFSVIAYDGEKPIGLVNSFYGFSTFLQKKLVNVHDVMVTESARGLGIAGQMIAEVEKIAIENDCCRLTLEVMDNNASARRAYEKFGFGRTPYHPDQETLFLQKSLTD